MSRIGNQVISVPEAVTVTIEANRVSVKGPKGEIEREFDPSMQIACE